MGSITLLDTPCRESPIRGGPGYGKHRNQQSLHRWIWEQINGPIPGGMVVMHLCDNRPCFRYDHLRLGTQAENLADAAKKGRTKNRYMAATHCVHGHEFTPENTYHPPRRPRHRHCKTCNRGARTV